MGMFDTFIPDPPIPCPICGGELAWWQGKDGVKLLDIWKQHCKYPVGFGVYDDYTFDIKEDKRHILPKEFTFYAGVCQNKNCGFQMHSQRELKGTTDENGVWRHTKFVIDPPVRARYLGENFRECSACEKIWEIDHRGKLAFCPNCKRLTKTRTLSPICDPRYPFLDCELWDDPTSPTDLAENHDKYLYDDEL